MANFLIVVDPDRDRRAAFSVAVRSRIAPVENLASGECCCSDFQALWASGPRAPVTQSTTDRSATVVWGAPLSDVGGRRLTAAQLADLWVPSASTSPLALDGYFAAVGFDAQKGIVIGADILGMFPVFWWHSGEVLLAGSSPELFRLHPLFRFDLDPEGLVGILLTMHSVGGRTLMAGVNRLGAGRALIWNKGSDPREVKQYELPASLDHFDLPFPAAVECLHDALKRSVARHTADGAELGLMLSGGRDSRLLAGLMVELGRSPVALTLGNDRDLEMSCAKAVARVLGLEHRTAEIRTDRIPLPPELHARWQHCCTGFNSCNYWHCHEDLGTAPPFLVSGYVLDSIVGGSHFGWAYSEISRDVSFRNFFIQCNRHGIEKSRLRKLLRPEIAGSLVHDVVQDLKETYESYSDLESQRAWCFDLHHRQRFHIGAPPWLLSFGSWPVLPAVDKELLKVTAGIPVGVLGERRAQDAVIRKHFPELAELPLDRNSFDTSPLSPRLRELVLGNLRAHLEPVTKLFRSGRETTRARLYYYRLLDFNGPAWRQARRQAEPHRGKLYALFNKDALDAMLPAPEIAVSARDPIIDLSGHRLLVGLALWAGEYL